jgi:hypothetical protein
LVSEFAFTFNNLCHYVTAKQRWQRAGAALGALRALKMAGGGGMGGMFGGGGMKSPPPAAAKAAPVAEEETPSRRQPRHSQNEIKKKDEAGLCTLNQVDP